MSKSFQILVHFFSIFFSKDFENLKSLDSGGKKTVGELDRQTNKYRFFENLISLKLFYPGKVYYSASYSSCNVRDHGLKLLCFKEYYVTLRNLDFFFIETFSCQGLFIYFIQ